MLVHSKGDWHYKCTINKRARHHTFTLSLADARTHIPAVLIKDLKAFEAGGPGPCSSLQESEEPFVSGKQLVGTDPFHWF